jgi:CubicO group peptidase (beta-lactamase class C family)
MMRMGEHPSGGNHSTGRGMAKFAAYMANKGSFEGKTLLSEKTWEEMHSEPKTE